MIKDSLNGLQSIVKITPSEGGTYIIENSNGKYFEISKQAADIIKSYNTSDEIKKPFDRYCEINSNISALEYNAKLEKLNSFLTQHLDKKDNSVLILSIPLINPYRSKKIGEILSPLLNKHFAITVSFFYAAILYYFYAKLNSEGISVNFNQPIIYFVIPISLAISSLFHEFGHVSSCVKNKAHPGEIGLGLYYIFPVFYSKLNEVWYLPRLSRIKVDLAGIWFELLLVALLTSIYIFINIDILLIISMSILVKTALELVPFLRKDGYWVLSDLIGTRSLSHDAKNEFKNIFLGRQSNIPKSKRNALAMYFFFNITAFYIFVFYIYKINYSYAIALPFEIYSSVNDSLFNYKLIMNHQFFWAIILYFLSLIVLVKTFKFARNLTNRKKGNKNGKQQR